MGGKKKTKWRKLPLEEFTKEIQTETEKVLPENEYHQSDPALEENNYNPTFDGTVENAQHHTEPYEYIDGLYYPTACVVYNPADVGMYPNFMMPIDTCYYYYTVTPEMTQMQEYVSMPYQEYVPPLAKDTVYLLLPAQSLRPTQGASNAVPEWQNRRRRRRYEGYADYAVIPEKPTSMNVKEKDSKNVGHHVNSRSSSSQSSNFKTMNSFPNTRNFENRTSVSERYQEDSKSSDDKKGSISSNSNRERALNFVTKEMNVENNQKRKKSLEVCGIHTKSTAEENKAQTTEERNVKSVATGNDLNTLHTEKSFNEEQSCDIAQIPENSNKENVLHGTHLQLEIKGGGETLKEQSDKTGDRSLSMKHKSQESNQEVNLESEQSFLAKEKSSSFPVNTITTKNIKIEEDIHESSTHAPLPDILSTLNKPPLTSNLKNIDDLSSSVLPNSVNSDKGISPKTKSFLSQTSNLPTLLSSEALHNEVELELNQLQNLHSLQANQSIYKLAFDENVTDQSEVNSRSLSPIDPEIHIPSSLLNDEIIIHEADSGSEAGSEDLELIPHRYESESFLNGNKHMYVNKLSLAVELLRTRESLPYDAEFKRVVGENTNIVPVHTSGKVNLGFMDDSSSPNTLNNMNNVENKGAATRINSNQRVSQWQTKYSAHSSNDSAIFSDTEYDNLDEEGSCESAKEVQIQENENQENTEGIRAGYRRFGTQARYFSPRAALSFNPCFCCIIM